METINVIVINPNTNSVYSHVVDKSKGLQDYYVTLDCRSFDIAHFDENNDVFVDDEGLFTLTHETRFFSVEGYEPLAGVGIVAGVNHENGETISTTLSVEEVRAKVKFYSIREVMELEEAKRR